MLKNFLKNKLKKFLSFSFVALIGFSVPSLALAATDLDVSDEFKSAVSTYYNIAIGFIIILAVLMIIIGGYTLVFSSGRPGLVEKGKKQIINAIIGLVIAILSAVFLNFLNPAILGPQS